jgi:hypothetical protein
MFPVIDVIAAAFHPSRSKNPVVRRPWSGNGRRMSLTGTAEKPLFNIGRIPVRQSRSRFCRRQAANLAAGQEKRRRRGQVVLPEVPVTN